VEVYNDTKFDHILGIEINDVEDNKVELGGNIIIHGLTTTSH